MRLIKKQINKKGLNTELLHVTILIIGLASLAIFFFEMRYADRFYPGVYVGGRSVGGMSYTNALQYFNANASALQQNGIDIYIKGAESTQKIKVPSSRTGLTSDNITEYFSLGNWEMNVQQAYSWGRNESLTQRIISQVALIFKTKNFELDATFHKESVRSLISRDLQDFLRQSIPARLILKKGTASIEPETVGQHIDTERLMEDIQEKLHFLDSAPLYREAQPDVPSSTQASLLPFLKVAQEIATSVNITFYYQKNSWAMSGKKLITWLTIKESDKIGIDEKKLGDFLAKNAAIFIEHPPQDSRFALQNHKLVEIIPGKAGNIIDVKKTAWQVDRFVSNIQKSIASAENHTSASVLSGTSFTDSGKSIIDIPIQIIQAQPKITKKMMEQYEINDLVGMARTSFKGSSKDRIHNINVGVSKLNGLLIPPGQEFSAISAIGTTSEEQGFVQEFVIKEDKTIKELGGGLCQIATTLFRLALNGGLPVTERSNHRYLVSYYGPGLDATIYDPAPDLKFINDTGNYLLLQGRVINDSEVVFEFYGQKDGRTVELSDPVFTDEIPAPGIKFIPSDDLPFGEMQCSETPRKGLTADVLYGITYPTGEKKTQNFHSVYQPWQKICLIGLKK